MMITSGILLLLLPLLVVSYPYRVRTHLQGNLEGDGSEVIAEQFHENFLRAVQLGDREKISDTLADDLLFESCETKEGIHIVYDKTALLDRIMQDGRATFYIRSSEFSTNSKDNSSVDVGMEVDKLGYEFFSHSTLRVVNGRPLLSGKTSVHCEVKRPQLNEQHDGCVTRVHDLLGAWAYTMRKRWDQNHIAKFFMKDFKLTNCTTGEVIGKEETVRKLSTFKPTDRITFEIDAMDCQYLHKSVELTWNNNIAFNVKLTNLYPFSSTQIINGTLQKDYDELFKWDAAIDWNCAKAS